MTTVNNIQTRKATVQDARKIHALIVRNARDGKMLARSLNEIFERIRSFFVIEIQDEIVGCCCLHVMWEDLAEIKSLSVAPEHQGKGFGAVMIAQALDEARELLVPHVFALTFIPQYFKRFGFMEVDKNDLPKKIWIECVNCLYYPDCGEIAVMRDVD